MAEHAWGGDVGVGVGAVEIGHRWGDKDGLHVRGTVVTLGLILALALGDAVLVLLVVLELGVEALVLSLKFWMVSLCWDFEGRVEGLLCARGRYSS